MRSWCAIVTLAACSSSPSSDVVGPFTGEVRRYVVDAIAIPRDSSMADALAGDLDGDGKPENQLGAVAAVLASINDLSADAADMIASGALASSVEIQADELEADPSVGVRYLGADGDPATVAGGRFVDGVLRTNRARDTRAPGRAVLRLPMYTNADPLVVELEGMELDLVPDGRGGYDAVVRGGLPHESAMAAAHQGLVQMIATEPERHLVFARQIDTDRDGTITRAEVDESVIALLVAPDIRLFDGDRYAPGPGPVDSVSVAFAAHLAPCPEGRCTTGAPVEACRDRVRDGDETGVDCGGGCQPCADGASCAVADDCQSRACEAGTCAAATCSDGVRDALESDVDCGGACGPCAIGQACAADDDCATGDCDNGVAAIGHCR